jgi:hypothetical protein
MLAPIAERQRRPETALWREFELARLRILGALLDAAAHGLQMLPQVRLEWLLRMADFALWVAASEMGFHPEGAFEAAYSNNRRDAIENIVRPTQWRRVCVRLWPTERNGREALPDLLLAGANVVGNPMVGNCAEEGLGPVQPASERAGILWPARAGSVLAHGRYPDCPPSQPPLAAEDDLNPECKSSTVREPTRRRSSCKSTCGAEQMPSRWSMGFFPAPA